MPSVQSIAAYFQNVSLEHAYGRSAKIFLAELRVSGESDHWRVDARYTGAVKNEADGDSDNQQDKDEKKKPALPEDIKLSILVRAGDRSVVDLQIDAMERAIALLQATVGMARQEQLRPQTARD